MAGLSESCVAPVHLFPLSVREEEAKAVVDEVPDVYSLVNEEIIKEQTGSIKQQVDRAFQLEQEISRGHKKDELPRYWCMP